MVSPASESTPPWSIVDYEAVMFFRLCSHLGSEASQPDSNTVNNAMVESACLHARILIDILLSKNSGKDDDIRLDELSDGFPHESVHGLNESVDQLRTAYGKSGTEQSPCWILNKMIAHPTLKRGTSRDYTEVLNKLFPLIKEVLQEIQNHRPGFLSDLLKPTGGVDSRFCAKTSSESGETKMAF